MNTLKNVGKRVVALVLALMMCVGMLATTAFAEPVKDNAHLTCTVTEHTHTSACNSTECSLTAHVHGVDCHDPIYSDTEHTHVEGQCYTTSRGKLICTKEEHTHWGADGSLKDCYTYTYTCGKETHIHTMGLCDWEYTCTKDHDHNLITCDWHYTCPKEEHTHIGCQLGNVITCSKEEHTHSDACYEVVKTYTCTLEEHTHTDACITGWNCAETGHTHGTDCVYPRACGMTEHTHGDACYSGHVFENYTSNNDATCTANGTETATCKYCTATDTREIADTKLPHSFTKWAQVGTSKHVKVCAVCGKTQATSEEAHQLDGEWTIGKEATCTEAGWKTGKCICGAPMRETIPALGHDYVNGICANCGEEDPNYDFTCKEHVWIAKSGVGITTAPTCTSNGVDYIEECKNCHATRIHAVAALKHDFSVSVADDPRNKAATCTETGAEVYKCSRCPETQVTELPMKAHTRVDAPEVPATCTETGIAAHWTCSDCGKLFKGTSEVTAEALVIPIDRNNHTGETNVWTYVDDGAHGKFCTDCHKQYATGSHSFGDWAYNEAEQSWSRACADCGYTQTTTDASAIHVCAEYWSEDFQPSGNGHVHVCTFPGCGNVSAAETHEFDEWEVITAARPGVAGERAHTCWICGLTETDTIPALPDGTGDVVIDDTNPPLDGNPDGEVELDDGEIPLAGPVTRAEFVDYLYRHEGAPDTALSTFVDVPADHDYANAVGWGQANNIAWGISETEFAPDELVTVEQVKLFLSRYAAFKGSEMPELAALVGLDDQDPAMNCDEILGEFFGADE